VNSAPLSPHRRIALDLFIKHRTSRSAKDSSVRKRTAASLVCVGSNGLAGGQAASIRPVQAAARWPLASGPGAGILGFVILHWARRRPCRFADTHGPAGGVIQHFDDSTRLTQSACRCRVRRVLPVQGAVLPVDDILRLRIQEARGAQVFAHLRVTKSVIFRRAPEYSLIVAVGTNTTIATDWSASPA